MRTLPSIHITYIFILIFILVGCGPIYDTHYRFEPPKERAGTACIEGCEDIEDECERQVRIEYDYCQDYNQDHTTRCSEKIAREKNRSPKITECGNVRSCSSSTSECEANYRLCYERCGGTVREERVCIMNCPEINQ